MSDRHAQLRAHFERAQGLDPASREELITSIARSDQTLAEELASLLEIADTPGFLDEPLADLASRLTPVDGDGRHDQPAACLPQSFGRYTLTAVLGRGGQGTVYRATQAQPNRQVAVKILEHANVSPGLGRRFAHEAEALAMLTHVGIAQIFEAGTATLTVSDGATAPDGAPSSAAEPGATRSLPCPFIAMELVEGPRLDEYVRQQRPEQREIVRLLIAIADAVDHAHKRGVIHRDLKPGNIIVARGGDTDTGGGCQPKVLDFGIARLTRAPGSPRSADATLNVTTQQIIGTLAYMSPEQAAGQAGSGVDSRSDVYALGVIAFELLCGRPPRDTSTMTLPEALRAIAESDAPRPRTLVPSLPADLEAIVVKAMARQPQDRYQHASSFADDLRRFLAGEPVTAKRYSRAEQARRFVARNRLAVGGVAALLLSLAGGVIATSWQARIASQERDAARQESASARAAANMVRRILRAASPEESRGQDLTVRQMLTIAEAELLSENDVLAAATEAGGAAAKREDRDQARYGLASALATLAETRLAMGDAAIAVEHARRADELFQRTPRAASSAAIENRSTLARGLVELDRRSEAAEIAAESLKMATAAPADEENRQQAIFSARLASIYTLKTNQRADRLRAIEAYRSLLADIQAVMPHDDPSMESIKADMAVELEETGQRDEALKISCEIYATRIKRLGRDHPETLLILHNIAVYTGEMGKLDAAIDNISKVIAGRTAVLGASHNSTLRSRDIRAQFNMRRGDFAAAMEDARAVYDARTKLLGPGHSETLLSRGILATCLLHLKRLDDAAREIAGLVEQCRATHGDRGAPTLQALTLAWDLAEAQQDNEGMIRHARALVGSEYEQAVRQQMDAKGLRID